MLFGNKIGYEIKHLRKNKHINRKELAEKAKLDVVYLNLIERNKKTISLETLIKISNALDVPILMFEKYKI